MTGPVGGRAGGLAVLIGSPVAHSLSPTIHRAAFAAAGVDWSYAALDVADGRGGPAVEAMRLLGIAGMSVTMPHKAAVADAVDRLEPEARSLRSVNTVSWDGDELVGSSTDGAGFVAALAEAGIDGMSVTMPHKTAVADAVDRLEPAARSLRSVNTVSWDGEELVRSEERRVGKEC